MSIQKTKDIVENEAQLSIVEFVFRETRLEMSRMSNLSIYLESLGNFFYGRKRLREFYERIEKTKEKRDQGIPNKMWNFVDEMSEEEMLDKKKQIDKLLEIYEHYVAEKKECREANKASRAELEERKKISSGMEEIPDNEIGSQEQIDSGDESPIGNTAGTVSVPVTGNE
jgi:septal ring factor EnvC (AmiA/AmiB activator)